MSEGSWVRTAAWKLAISGVSVVVAMVCLIPVSAALARVYYVSPRGSDRSSGTSPQQAWRTVYRVDKAVLRPGDVVLFQGGSRFSDQTLMPGWGLTVSGTNRSPVVFGSYGQGRATLGQGIWIKGERHLVFESLNLGPAEGISGTGAEDVVAGCTISNLMGSVKIAIDVIGSHWWITDNRIDRTGDSGMLLRGDHFLVTDNVITNTGLDRRITYGSHGIYLKAPGSVVTGNAIVHFRDEGVSVRYRNNIVSGNLIVGGRFGIAWHQYDRRGGTTWLSGNTIVDSSVAAIYVSPWDIGGTTHESFVITDNRLYGPASRRARAASAWVPLSLSRTRGRYTVRDNLVL